MKHVFSFLIWMVIGQLVKLYSCFKSSNCSNSNYHFSDQVSWSQTGWEERLLLGQKRSVWESKGAVQHFRVPHQDGAGGAGWPCQDTFLKLNLNFKVDVGSFTRGALQEGDSAKRRRLSGGRRWVPTITIVMDWEIFLIKQKIIRWKSEFQGFWRSYARLVNAQRWRRGKALVQCPKLFFIVYILWASSVHF